MFLEGSSDGGQHGAKVLVLNTWEYVRISSYMICGCMHACVYHMNDKDQITSQNVHVIDSPACSLLDREDTWMVYLARRNRCVRGNSLL